LKKIEIKKGTIQEAISISKLIPEFNHAYRESEYNERIGNKTTLVLIACDEDRRVGFKLGYLNDSFFYSWMGGILPAYRRCGIATQLADVQEQWVREMRIPKIRLKTLNRFKGMLIFALQRGFEIIGTEDFAEENTIKIILEKQLI
jgi:GNAT superfamily N-acetyltransferase